jgi:TatD DNase family protein
MQVPNITLIDSHCHLDIESFDIDREQVIDRAMSAGVNVFVNPGVDLDSSKKTLELASVYNNLYAAVGIHPNEAHQWDHQSEDEIERLANQPGVVAIGEIGLDYYRDRTSHEQQYRILEQQLAVAEKLDLPVIIHNREASNDLMAVLISWVERLRRNASELANRPGVLHSFSGDEAMLSQALSHNFYIGISGPVTYPNAQVLQRLVPKILLTHLLIETDSPFLSPQPQRGQRNEPGYVRFVAEKIAKLNQISLEEVAQRTTENAQKLFRIGEKTFA